MNASEIESCRRIRLLVEAYAAAVDEGRYALVADLFAPDGVLVTSRTAGAQPDRETVGRHAIADALAGLDRYAATLHDIANHRAVVDGDRATAVTSCLAHHVERSADGAHTDRVLAIRYRDDVALDEGSWRFARREVHILWIERRPVDR